MNSVREIFNRDDVAVHVKSARIMRSASRKGASALSFIIKGGGEYRSYVSVSVPSALTAIRNFLGGIIFIYFYQFVYYTMYVIPDRYAKYNNLCFRGL